MALPIAAACSGHLLNDHAQDATADHIPYLIHRLGTLTHPLGRQTHPLDSALLTPLGVREKFRVYGSVLDGNVRFAARRFGRALAPKMLYASRGRVQAGIAPACYRLAYARWSVY